MTIMYHDDHLTDSEKDMWSGLYLLADVAVMVEEEEQRLAEKGSEESIKCHKKGFFCRFPRKTRSSLVKRRYTQRNPNGTSTSSSSLTDYETKTSQNPSFDEPMVYDAKKGKAKIVCEDDVDGESDEERLFEKNVKRFVRQNFHNLDGASTSSSFLNLRCHEPSLLLYNMAKSEKTGMKDDPPNPNYQLENTSRKRCAVQQKNKSCNFKKAKVADPFPRMATETPEWIYQVMKTMKADAEEPWLIFERFLSASDVKTDQSRLLIPFKKLIRNDFLTPAECRAIKKDETNQNEDENIGVGTILVNQRSEKWGLRFKIWPMEKDSGRGTLYYIFNWGWNEVVKGNDLKADDKISLWTFRCRGVLCFALETY